MTNTKKTVLKTVCIVLAAVMVMVVGYLLYVVLSYHRIEDNLKLDISGGGTDAVPVGKELSLMTYNIGFGAYSPDYSFFMDGGKHSRALSKNAVINNTKGVIKTAADQNPDFVLLQEVDIKGTRSYKVNQAEMITTSLKSYCSVFAENYDSPYFLYPFNEPIGANKSGILTLSKYAVSSATRRSLPIENSFNKYLDLDRAYSVSVIKTENGKELALYNVHLSAYTSDGTISDEQLKMLSADMKSHLKKGNYVIAAGDFNKDMLGDSSEYFKRSEGEFNWAKPFDSSLLPKGVTVFSGSNAPTCRNADSPFRGDGTDFVLSVDGILVSENITVKYFETVDLSFAYSDHNPVRIEFTLN